MVLEELTENISNINDSEFSAIYSLEDEHKIDVYGILNKYNELVFVIKIFDEELLGQGLGSQAFAKLIGHFGVERIDVIYGSWYKDKEFAFFEDGMSTNLKVFNEKVIEMSPEEAARHTPTGKWAVKYGFTEVQIETNRATAVEVKFAKPHLGANP